MDIRKLVREILEEEFKKLPIVETMKELGFELDEKNEAYGYNSYFFYIPFEELQKTLVLVVETYSGPKDFPVDERLYKSMFYEVNPQRKMKHIFTKQIDNIKDLRAIVKPYIEKYKEKDQFKFLGIEPQKPKNLSNMEQSELEKLMNQALDNKDFESAKKIGKYIRQ